MSGPYVEKWKNILMSEAVRPYWAGFEMSGTDLVTIPFEVLHGIDPDMAGLLIDNYTGIQPQADEALGSMFSEDELIYKTGEIKKRRKPQIAVTAVPKRYEGGLASLLKQTTNYLSVFQPVTGYVKRVSKVVQKFVTTWWECLRCHALICEPARENDVFYGQNAVLPLECYKDQGGCGKSGASTHFMLITKPVFTPVIANGMKTGICTEYINYQEVTLQDIPGSTEVDRNPVVLLCHFYGDNCFKALPGDIVTVNGVLQTQYDKEKYISEPFFKVNSVEKQPSQYDDLVISAEDEVAIKAFSQTPDFADRLRNSVAPSIEGMETVKEALILQMLAGKDINIGGVKGRGNLNILLCGDPGVAKSQLLSSVAVCAQRAVRATGNTSSGAGLTAAVVKEENFGATAYGLEAGVMVLGNNGIALIDELEKGQKEDIQRLHEAMEQQSVTVSKAGINVTLPAKTAVLAAANPKQGNFDPGDSIADQIGLQSTLLTRFDLIFIVRTITDPEKVDRLTSFMLDARAGLLPPPPLEIPFMRKYIAFAKRIRPTISAPAGKLLQSYFKTMVAIGAQNKTIAITPRQFESLERLTEACAKLRLSETADEKDAERAVTIMKNCLDQYAGEGGVPDLTMVINDDSREQAGRMGRVKELIGEYGLDGADPNWLIRVMGEEGTPRAHVEKDLKKLQDRNEIYKLENGNLKLSGGSRR